MNPSSNCQLSTVNCQLIVIADDITGAAEMAGIGLEFGFKVNLIMYSGEAHIVFPEHCDLLVIATDTRSMTKTEAVEETTRLSQIIKEARYNRLFKKTDSVLRGYIIAELQALMNVFEIEKALLLPQNPSRKRIIAKGRYYIGSELLDKTSFAHDPEFPAISSEVNTLLGIDSNRILPAGESIEKKGIFVMEASSQEEVFLRAQELNDEILPAGGADFFSSYLTLKGYKKQTKPKFEGLKDNGVLIILGSTARHPIFETAFVQRHQIPACNTPRLLFYRKAPRQWTDKIKRKYREHNALILHTNYPTKKGKEFAVKLREGMSKVAEEIWSEFQPHEIIIEGGATAFAVLKRLRWNTMNVKCEVIPGVIRLTPATHPDVTVTLKPGSYPWGELFS